MGPDGEENFAKFGWVGALSRVRLSFAKFSRFVPGLAIERSSLAMPPERRAAPHAQQLRRRRDEAAMVWQLSRASPAKNSFGIDIG